MGEAIMSHRFTFVWWLRGEIHRKAKWIFDINNQWSINPIIVLTCSLQDRWKFFVDTSEAIYEPSCWRTL